MTGSGKLKDPKRVDMDQWEMNYQIQESHLYRVTWKLDGKNLAQVIAICNGYDLSDIRITKFLDEKDLVDSWDLDNIAKPYWCEELGTMKDFPEYFL